MRRTRALGSIIGVILIGFGFQLYRMPPPPEFEVPPGFAVEQVIGPEQAGSAVAITFDSRGRLVLSREDTSIVAFVDPDGDGVFEERVFTDQVVEAQGIVFDGSTLIAVGEGPEGTGMYRIFDLDQDLRGDRVELMEPIIGEMGDHGPHQPYFGPDGYMYWSIGNFAALREPTAPLSPLRDWKDANLEVARTNGFAADTRAPGSIVVRTRLDDPNAGWEMVVGGMRNHYDGAFNMLGELFTYDSDMEWDRGLPWFRETSSIHLAPGGDFGWRSGNMKHPAYYIDDLPPMEYVGRGSPTGVTFYQSYRYPERYYDMFLQADWSRGRIIMGHLTRDGATYSQDSDTNFVFATPLNVVDVETGPDGNVYFALGGRDTEGGVYRVVYTGEDAMNQPAVTTPIDEALTLPQPRSAFSRRRASEIKVELGLAAWQRGLADVVRNPGAAPERRVRAMELLVVHGPGLGANTLASLTADPSWKVRAAAAYYLGMTAEDRALQALVGLLHDEDPFVQRRAAEGLLRSGVHPAADVPFSAVEDVMPLLASPDRFVRYAGRALLREIDRRDWQAAALAASGFPQAPEALLAIVQSMDSPYMKDIELIVERELELLRMNPSNDDLLALLRTMQRTMLEDHGVVFGQGFFGPQNNDGLPEGYAGIGQELLDRFPTNDWRVNREIARILAYLEPAGAAPQIAEELENEEIDRQQQMAYADALSFFESGWDEPSIERVATWLGKVYSEEWRGGRQFMSYIGLMEEGFLENVPDSARAAVAASIDQAKPAVEEGEGFARRLNLSPVSKEELEEELIFNPSAFDADPAEGVHAYEKALCISCHTFGPIGTEVGPDLTTVNQRFNRQDLVTAILRPSETVSDLWEMTTITKTNGEMISGTIFNETNQEVVLQIAAGPQITIPKSEIASRDVSSRSSMPEDLMGLLNGGEREALIMLLEAGPSAIPDTALARIDDR